MIALAVAALLANPTAPLAPAQARKEFGACLTKYMHEAEPKKLDAAAYKAGAHTSCAAQESAFRTAWVAYDVGMKTRRADAEESAAAQIEDYLQNSVDTYTFATNPPKP